MCKKCICLLRVSTKAQSENLVYQRKVVIANAIADGYEESEIVTVEKVESAIKLDEEEREGLNEMKKIIRDNPSIESVYVFAIDRLARKVSTVLSIKDYLLSENINLVFINPRKLSTLIKNNKGEWEKDKMTEMMLMFLGYGAEMEMEIKMVRFKEKKAELRAQNKVSSGALLYGYKKNPNTKMAEVDEENEAKIVREIFYLYNHKGMSMLDIYNYYVGKGIFKAKKTNASKNSIRRILINKAYTGDYSSDDKVKNLKYPPIIDNEEFELTKQIIAGKRVEQRNTNNIYLAKGIIFNKVTNCGMIVHVTNCCYKNLEDEPRYSININVVDRVVWLEAVQNLQVHKEVEHLTAPQEYANQINELEQQIRNIEDAIAGVEKMEKDAFNKYLKGKVSDSIYDETIENIKADKRQYEKEIAKIKSQISTLQIMQSETNEAAPFNPRTIENISREDKHELVKKYIEKVIISKDEKFYYIECKPIIYFTANIGYKMKNWLSSQYRYSQRGGVMKLECNLGIRGKWIDITNTVEMIYKHKKKG